MWIFFLFRKGILDEYSQITSLVTEEIVNVHKEIQTSVEQIDPNTEYSGFIETHRYIFSLSSIFPDKRKPYSVLPLHTAEMMLHFLSIGFSKIAPCLS